MTIKQQLIAVKNRITQAEQEFNRPTGSVQLLAVSKTWPASQIRQLASSGQLAFGENYLQEALEKIDQLSDIDLTWHFIGPIQSNKTRPIAEHFDWVHSVDRLKVAQRLATQRPEELSPLNVCIQVNIDNESTKSGASDHEVPSLAAAISQLPQLALRGLMIIPTKTRNLEQQHTAFNKAKLLFDELAETYSSIDTLSMGMSADMALAIAHGSTLVRIGSALFGQRATPRDTGTVN